MKSVSQDGGECWRKWYATRQAHLLRLSGPPPKDICVDQLKLTTCIRYAELLLENPQIFRYLSKNHSTDLRRLQRLIEDFKENFQLSESGSVQPKITEPQR
jgi:hypothetical protein